MAVANQTILFHSLRQLYQRLNMYSPETNRTHPFSWKIVFAVSSILILFITSVAFFLWEAETLDEYGTSFYSSVTQLSTAFYFIVVVWRMPTILNLLKNFDEFIESSELIYDEYNLLTFEAHYSIYPNLKSVQEHTITFHDTCTIN